VETYANKTEVLSRKIEQSESENTKRVEESKVVRGNSCSILSELCQTDTGLSLERGNK